MDFIVLSRMKILCKSDIACIVKEKVLTKRRYGPNLFVALASSIEEKKIYLISMSI